MYKEDQLLNQDELPADKGVVCSLALMVYLWAALLGSTETLLTYMTSFLLHF